jgi:hypothetical protein
MTSFELSAKERAALFALLAGGRKLSNPALGEQVGFRLDGQERRRLNSLGLVNSEKSKPGRAYEHTLTNAGCQRCADELSMGPAAGRSTSIERALYAFAAGFLQRSGKSLQDIFASPDTERGSSADVESLIKARYRELAARPGEFVKLHELRTKLSDIPRTDLDSALDRMYRGQRINLVAQADQESLTNADRESALLIGGSRKHRISIGES